MEVFLKANPGLSSRFDKTIRFVDYTPHELEDIAIIMIETEGYKLSVKSKNLLNAIMTDLYSKRDKYFGNARTVRKLILEIIKNQNLRISAIPQKRKKKDSLILSYRKIYLL